jgi:hypothetical protein
VHTQGHVHALLLIGVVGLAVGIGCGPIRTPPARSGLGRRAAITLLGALAILAAGLVGIHLCGAGQPFLLWLLPAIAWLPAGLRQCPARRRRHAFPVAWGGALVLSVHCSTLVHDGAHTGSPSWTQDTARRGEPVEVRTAWHTPFTGLYHVHPATPPQGSAGP